MILKLKKRLLRPQQIVNFKALLKYSAIAFCLSSNTIVTSSFSLEPRSTRQTKSVFEHKPKASPFLVHRGGSINPLKMTSTSTESVASPQISDAGAKLESLRSKMEELGLDAYIVPSDDPHLSEYVPPAYARRSFISGFGGSAGTAIIFKDEALLWTDSRYVMLMSLL